MIKGRDQGKKRILYLLNIYAWYQTTEYTEHILRDIKGKQETIK